MKKHRLLIIGILCICIIITLIFIWYKRTHKFSYFFTSNEYTIEQSKSDKIIKFNLDLTNPEAEIDRKIEIDDNCYFEIVALQLQSNNQYTIVFESYGNNVDNPKYIYTANYYNFQNDKVFITSKTDLISNKDENWYYSSNTYFQDNGDSFGFNIESEIVKNKENCVIEISNLNYIEFKKKID
mgnify:FL=1